jgi:hypothetical protein
MKTLSTIFYIYSEASLAVFLACMGILEFICALFIGPVLQPFALSAGCLFFIVAFALAHVVYRKARRANHL